MSTRNVSNNGDATGDATIYHGRMADPAHDWYLPDWLHTLRLRQARLVELTGWSKGKVSKLYNGQATYDRDIINTVARALNLEPFELLLHPADAMALRRLRESALRIAAETRRDYVAEPADLPSFAATR